MPDPGRRAGSSRGPVWSGTSWSSLWRGSKTSFGLEDAVYAVLVGVDPRLVPVGEDLRLVRRRRTRATPRST